MRVYTAAVIFFVAVLSSSWLVAGCDTAQFPVVPTPVANVPVTTLSGSSYSGNIVLGNGTTTSFNMTLIARGLGLMPVQTDAQVPGTVEVSGSYKTGTGLVGTIGGNLQGTLENGSFQGELLSDAPKCSRSYTGLITSSSLAWIPGGAGASECPLTFSIQIESASGPECAYSISLNRQSFSGNGDEGTVHVDTASGCAWAVEPLTSWITVSDTAPQSSSGSASFRVLQNPGATRQGQLRVADQTLTITQGLQGLQCSYVVSPTNATVQNSGGSGQISVTTGSGCDWMAESQASWITVSPTSGKGNGPVAFTAQANTGPSRQGTLLIAGQTVVVTQGLGCTYFVAPTSPSVPKAGGSGQISVTAAAGCEWKAQSQVSWISVSPASGSGNGAVTFTVAANTGAARTGTLTIAGKSVTVRQDCGDCTAPPPSPCTYALSNTTLNVGAAGGSQSITVTTGSTCLWTVTSGVSWIHPTPPTSVTGSGLADFTVDANVGAARSGTLTIADQTVTVNQAGVTYGLSVAGNAQPWCSSAFTIQSDPSLGFGAITAPGPFQTRQRSVAAGTVVRLSVSGPGAVTWTDCDSVASGVCTVTMNANRCGGCALPPPRAAIAGKCPTPSFSSVSKTVVSENWVIRFTAINLVPFDGQSVLFDTFTASCPGFSTSTRVSSSSSGTITDTISVPTSACDGGTLTVTDHNGTATTKW